MDNNNPDIWPNLKPITEYEKQVIEKLLKDTNPNNKLIYLDMSELIKKYLINSPNNILQEGKYKYKPLLYERLLIPFISNPPDKII
jgi:hypothetical protein